MQPVMIIFVVYFQENYFANTLSFCAFATILEGWKEAMPLLSKQTKINIEYVDKIRVNVKKNMKNLFFRIFDLMKKKLE